MLAQVVLPGPARITTAILGVDGAGQVDRPVDTIARVAEQRKKKARPMVGWREWVALPNLGVDSIKAKIDTGARTSSLHAFGLRTFERDGETWARFEVHPLQKHAHPSIPVEVPIAGTRLVRNTSGHQQPRPYIVTPVELMGRRWEIEITLANRDQMGFRMLLGRQAVRRRFLLDPGRSFLAGRPAGTVDGPRRDDQR